MVEDLKKVVDHYHEHPDLKVSDEEIAELIEMGVDEALIDDVIEPECESHYEVLQENWPAVRLYLSCYGQFRVAGSGHILGFDFGAVEIDMRRSDIEIDAESWQKFKLLQQFTITLLNERSKTS
ncbi:MAG: DUF1799 domain-containing protein [Pseudohongiellaceae bacterium]|nr:DUF1799 domain-containing protein [Pseudohongiellaceae bacterium]